jgi:hypothetical protein
MKILLFILPLILIGCGHTPDKVVLDKLVYVNVECEDFGHITGIKPLPVVFVRAVDTEGYQVLGLRGDMYSNLSINSAETLRYIKEQTKAIGYYEKCIEDHNSTQDEEGGP